MNEILSTIPLMQLISMLVPILLLQLVLIIFSLIQLNKHGVKNLNKTIWILIIVFITTIGPILYLIIGRNDNDHS